MYPSVKNYLTREKKKTELFDNPTMKRNCFCLRKNCVGGNSSLEQTLIVSLLIRRYGTAKFR